MKRVLCIAALLLVVLALFAACGDGEPEELQTVTVTFNSNGGAAVAAQSVNAGTAVSKPQDPARIGYTFAGWTYEGKAWSFSDVVSADITLVANWTPTEYTITYNLNGGENAESNPATYTIESETITFAEPTRAGYSFVAWSTPSIQHGSMGNKTVTAVWSDPISYTITYDLAGGAFDGENQNPPTYTVNSPDITITGTPKRDGFSFACWSISSIPHGSTGDVTVTAIWSNPISYTITYNLDGGTNAETNPATYTAADETIVFAEPTREGYDFAYWSPTSITTGSTGAVTVTAHWTPIEYTITYELAGGAFDGENPNPTKYTIENADITITGKPTKAGYNFAGWDTTTIPSGSTGNVTVTAQWKQIFEVSENAVTGLTDHGKTLATVEIPSKIDGNDITSIGENAFKDCTALTSVTIPNGVTSIGASAFSGCTELTSVTIPTSVTSIGADAFSGCNSELTISYQGTPAQWNGVAKEAGFSYTVEYYTSEGLAFELTGENTCSVSIGDCTDKDIVIPSAAPDGKTVTSIKDEAFSGCTALTSITIPSTVKTIGENAFSGCTALTSVTIPNSVTSIGDWAFDSCTALTSITIPNGVERIGNYAFSGCTALKSITIPTSVTSIGGFAFNGCSDLTIYYQGTDAEWAAIDKNDDWNTNITGHKVICFSSKGLAFESTGDDTCSVSIGDCTDTNVVISSRSPDGKAVTSIGENAFKDSELTSITIPTSVTSIGASAFEGCTALESITIPTSVTSIGADAFKGCSSLTITYQGTQEAWDAIGNDCNPDNREVKVFTPAETTGALAFETLDENTCAVVGIGDCTDTELVIPSTYDGKTVTAIGIGLDNGMPTGLCGCTTITSVTIPNTVTKIDIGAFYECTALTSVTIPTSVTEIGVAAFAGCNNLTINYEGSEAEWNAIVAEAWYGDMVNYTIKYNYTAA